MKLRELRKVLQTIVLAGLPLGCAGGTEGHPDCPESSSQRTVTLRAPLEPQVEFQRERCRVDADACAPLCATAGREVDPHGPYIEDCEITFLGDDTRLKLTYIDSGCVSEGRRPAGLLRVVGFGARDRAGAYLAQAAWLEAASIHAFVELARELEARGAPAQLVRAALAAAADEVRHTELMSKLALRYGGQPRVPEVVASAPRTLEAMAIENAVEGCVRETWGAICAMWQAQTALDVEARRVFEQLAKDELRHAQLAWSIDAWLAPQLDDVTRAKVAAARQLAARQLVEEAAELRAVPALGLPGAEDARGMLGRAQQALWRAA